MDFVCVLVTCHHINWRVEQDLDGEGGEEKNKGTKVNVDITLNVYSRLFLTKFTFDMFDATCQVEDKEKL